MCGNDAGVPRIDMTLLPLPEAGLRNPEVRTRASGRAPHAMPSAARMVPRLVAMAVSGDLIAAMELTARLRSVATRTASPPAA